MDPGPIKIVQVSDIHLLEDCEGELLGVPTQKSFDAVLQLIRDNKENMDLILLTGDLSQDETESSYKRIAQKLKEFNVPIYWVPGNHDNYNILSKVFPNENITSQRHIVLKEWQIILLNSQIPEQVPGRLDESQLNFLKECLLTYPQHDAIIVFHHHPIKVGSKWIDEIGVQNAEEFWKILSQFHNVNSIVFGHVHQEKDCMHERVRCLSVPSTCIQFKPHEDKFALDFKNPGYRWIHLYPNGKLETGVKRTKEYIGVFDEDAEGY